MGIVTNQYKARVNSCKGIRNKIAAYYNSKLNDCKKESVLNSVLMEVMHPHHPLYKRILEIVYRNENDYIEDLLKGAQENNEIIECDIKFFTESLSLFFDAVKQEEMRKTPENFRTDLTKNKDEYILFIVNSMIKSIQPLNNK